MAFYCGFAEKYSIKLTGKLSRSWPMTDFPHQPQRFLARFSLDSWVVALASALIVLIIAGILPRVVSP
jgi:fermentation-respiration switch protein FrsA (DUF1100 family)